VKQATKSRKSQEYYVDGILQGNRVVLAQAITLVESSLPSDQDLASQVLEKTIQKSGNSIRVGITGSPGVGKSTFIEAFGKFLTGLGKKVAVLTVDPTSQKTKGSILGDKTRMPQLATNPDAFIRPSSAGETLGGVANNTREAILLTEAAGFEIIIIETVGVGQSEVAVRNMTDFFLLLMLPGSGDELQGIKKGIMEMADLLVITKADGENLPRAKRSQAEFQQAVHTLYDKAGGLIPKVLTASALLSTGLEEIHDSMSKFISTKKQSGDFARNRGLQDIAHMHDNFQQRLKDEVSNSSFLREKFAEMEVLVKTHALTPGEAGKKLLGYFQQYLQAKAPENTRP
jgi:LAO/AO transport system kinase